MNEEFKELNMVKQPNIKNQFKGEMINMKMNEKMVETLKENVLQTERAKVLEDNLFGSHSNKDTLVLGIGACGGNNAHLAHQCGYASMALNTAAEDATNIVTDHLFIIENAYGSGKSTKRAKEKFRQDEKRFISYVAENCPQKRVIITGAGTGGTGAGLMATVAGTLKRNFPDKDIFVIAVSGSITEDINAQENMARVIRELDKVGVNYLIFDNDRCGNSMSIDEKFNMVNKQVIDAIRILSGEFMKTDATTLMDPIDWQTLLSANKRMIVVSGNFDKRVSGDCNYEQQMIDAVSNSVQLPTGGSPVWAYCFFLNIKADMYKEIDEDFRKIQETFGEPYVTPKHLQNKSEGPDFGFVIAGLDAPLERLKLINNRINEFNEGRAQSRSLDEVEVVQTGVKRVVQSTAERASDTSGKIENDFESFDMFDEE